MGKEDIGVLVPITGTISKFLLRHGLVGRRSLQPCSILSNRTLSQSVCIEMWLLYSVTSLEYTFHTQSNKRVPVPNVFVSNNLTLQAKLMMYVQ